MVGIDIVEQLTEFSKNNLRKDQPQLLQSIILVTGDGSVGYSPKAPYDAIHVGAAADGPLTALHQQLKPGGRMIVPVGPQGGTQYLEQHDKREDGKVVVKRLMGVRYGSLVRKEVKPDQAQNGVRHAPVVGMSDSRRAQEAERRAREAEGRARTAEREKEVAIGEKEAAKRAKEAAEREKAVAIWEKEAAKMEKEAVEREKAVAIREKEAAKMEKEAVEREKAVAIREKEETKRGKEAAETAKLVAIREKEEAKRGKEAAERGREVAETRRQECERMLEELESEKQQQQQQVEAYWAVERREIQLTDQEIGRGAWATVSVAVFRGARVAAKCVHSQIISPHNIQLFKREMDMAARIRHPNLLLFIGATLQGEMVILTELMSTSLRKELEREYQLTPRLAIAIGLDVARALNYLHLMRPHPLIHRDISSANVLLESLPNGRWRAKVSDYGTVNLQRNLTTSNPGNPCYSAPEAYNPSQQSPKMDIFSFGALLTEMLAGKMD